MIDTANHRVRESGPAAPKPDAAPSADQAVIRELRAIRDLLAEQSAELLDAAATARLLGISEPTLYRLKSAGTVPAPIHVGGSAALVRWRRKDLLAWLREQRPAK